MVDSRKIVLGLFGIYLVILANVSIVDGDIVTTVTDSLVIGDDSGGSNVTPNAGDVEGEMSTAGTVECVCDCNQKCQDCLTAEGCATKAQNIQNEKYSSVTNSNSETTESGIAEDSTAANKPPMTTTTGTSNTGEDTSTGTPPPLCSIPGVQPDQSNCRAYHECSSIGVSDGSNRLVTKLCAPNESFNVEFGRCSRDLSSCTNAVVCQIKGGIADPASNSSYYWCEPRLIGVGFLIFHVKCSAIEVFYPQLGKCFIDITNLNQQPYPTYPPYNWNQIKDVDIVKAEIKLIKEQDKLKLKEEKERLKAERTLQKEIQKEAERRAKEQEKLHKALAKQESATFVCPQAGNFPSTVSATFYYMCVSKKGTFKVVTMQCPIGSKFDAATGICVVDNLPNVNQQTF